jgi:putative membrane-bound dehydrogenase-like protein
MMRGKLSYIVLVLTLLVAAIAWPTAAQKADKTKEPIPHGQDQLPGPPLSPQEAIKKMKVPDGFSVELVAAEPDIVNPVAMTFDEKGRIWITESLEYPRRDPGPGRDRIKVLESTKGDGRYDKITVFADGLNIPSGIAVGHGGVWVANAPDILFYKIGADGKAAGKPEVVVTGFGRFDTHELPNTLTWGPDGWLYGLNGVFNPARVKQNGKTFDFTCALFRIHPKTREFQLFCEGTSNPWGLAWDNDGSAFVSACVIDHLWHLTETGYYHRQGGPYPPFTWKLDSIVKHKHQKAAYCGLHFFDSDAYPPEYREKLYMGNIHGGCINSDELTRDGSTYFAKPRPDFLTANDAWFMPVAQKTGPDGCLYILDWYDRYHCYQDANRDPNGIDRDRGRLYRIRYKDTPRAGLFDLAKESDEQLIQRLHSPNVYFRDLAQRLLCERDSDAARGKLEQLVLDNAAPRKARMHALWSLIGTGRLNAAFHEKLLAHKDSAFRAWAVRAAGNFGKVETAIRDKVLSLATDEARNVQLQVAIAARKLEGVEPFGVYLRVLDACGDDKLIPPIVWQNLHPLLEDKADAFLALAEKSDLSKAVNLKALMPRVIERLLGRRNAEPAAMVKLYSLFTTGKSADATMAHVCLFALLGKVETGEIAGDRLAQLKGQIVPLLKHNLEGKPEEPLYFDSALLATALQEPLGYVPVRQALTSKERSEADRLQALDALIAEHDAQLPDLLGPLLASGSLKFREQVLTALGRLEEGKVGELVLAEYPHMEPDLQPKAIELLTQRTGWSKLLLAAVTAKKIPAGAVNVNQIRKLLASKDADLVKQTKATWGTVREGRNPEREQVVADMRKFLTQTKGDAVKGQQVFTNFCAQCHKIHGEGKEVGPDITANGRATFEQLLSNVFDPSLVIGAGYQATTVTTKKGRTLTGLLVEETPQRVVLKQQGGESVVIAADDIDDINRLKVSLMPEGIEKQLKPQELADLFAFLCLDKPPSDPAARKIPGTPK